MFEPLIDELYVITRKLARHVATMRPIDGDRNLKSTIDNILKEAILAGTFRGSDWIVAYCVELENWYRLNGKHSSLLFSDENIPTRKPNGKPFKCRYIEYKVDTWDDLVDLNEEIDRRESGRSVADGYRNRAARTISLNDANDTLIKLIVGGLAHAYYGVSFTKNSTPKQRGQLIQENENFCAFAIKILGSKEKFLRMTAVVAAMSDSFAQDPEAALIFWLSVCDGSNTDTKSTERKLQLWLIDQRASVRNGRWSNALRHTCKTKCVAAWDRWYKAQAKAKSTPRRRSPKVTSRTNSSVRAAAKRTLK